MSTNKVRVEHKGGNRVLVVNGYDAAHIFTDEGHDGDRHWGVIAITSSFGNVGHFFGAIGPRPFWEFLLGCDWSYLCNKLWGLDSRQFDFDASVEAIRLRVVERRRSGVIGKDAARDCWDEIEGLESGQDEGFFSGQIYYDCKAIRKHIDIYEGGLTEKVDNPQCTGFHDDIWVHFCAWLRAEKAKVAA